MKPFKAATAKEPQKLHFTNKATGKGNKLQTLEEKRMKRKEALHNAMNKIHDPDIA